jgi:ABC-type uncharacterized transport system ATPase subunit
LDSQCLDSLRDISFDVAAGEALCILGVGRGRGRHSLSGTLFRTSRRIPEQVFFSGHPQIVTDMREGDWAGQHGETIATGIRNCGHALPRNPIHGRPGAVNQTSTTRLRG